MSTCTSWATVLGESETPGAGAPQKGIQDVNKIHFALADFVQFLRRFSTPQSSQPPSHSHFHAPASLRCWSLLTRSSHRRLKPPVALPLHSLASSLVLACPRRGCDQEVKGELILKFQDCSKIRKLSPTKSYIPKNLPIISPLDPPIDG